MSSKENNLTKVTEIGNDDSVRVLAGGASRNITKTNFVTTITQLLIDAGFLTASTLPATISNSRKIETFTTAHAIVVTDDVILMDATAASLGVTLPAAASFYNATDTKGQRVTVKKIDASNVNTVTITSIVPELIDGADSLVLETNGKPFVDILSDGVNWWLI